MKETSIKITGGLAGKQKYTITKLDVPQEGIQHFYLQCGPGQIEVVPVSVVECLPKNINNPYLIYTKTFNSKVNTLPDILMVSQILGLYSPQP